MESKKRSLAKAISWRFVATFITTTIVWLFTKEADFAVKVGLFDTMIKIFAYYAHERAWIKVPFGRKKPDYEI